MSWKFWRRTRLFQPRIVPQTADTTEVYRRLRTAFAERVIAEKNSVTTEITTPLSVIANQLGSTGTCVDAVPPSETALRAAIVQAHSQSILDIRKVSGTASVISQDLTTLAQDMGVAEVWSKTDADRRLVENQTAKEEADAFPPASWPRFVLGIATTFFGLGSAAISWEELTHATPTISWVGSLLAVPVVVPYLVGLYLTYLSLSEMREDDRKRRETYHYLFGGRKYAIREQAPETQQ